MGKIMSVHKSIFSCLSFAILILSSFSLALMILSSFSLALNVGYDDRAITLDGERKIIISGSIHYPRSTPDMWPSLIAKAKEGGLDTIETYVFWNAHEPVQGQLDFSHNLDLVKFIKEIQSQEMNAILRIGPYVCAEWTYGGLPVWLHSLPNIELRTNNEVFKNEMQKFVTMIIEMMKKENLFAPQGGPIILAQIENEYGNIMWKYGQDGIDYMNWSAQLAESFKIGIPWIMCQQDNAPTPMLRAANGYYADSWKPTPELITPKMWTENWVGWFKKWGGGDSKDPHRTAEDIAFAVARFFQLGGTVQNYYMYHGGTNFGISAGGPAITTTYDYDAPLDEYGNLNQPKYGHLKQLHLVLKSLEKILTHGNRTEVAYDQKDSWKYELSIYSYEGKRTCFFGNSDKEDYTFAFEGNNIFVPAWSVSILADCATEIFNTAKVSAQTSIMVKIPDEEAQSEPPKLKWTWRAEHALHPDHRGLVKFGSLISDVLVDQKRATNGTSDYMWVMTTIDVNETEYATWGRHGNNEVILHVNTDGHILHAFVNGKHVGTQHQINGGYFIFEKPIKLKRGKNKLSLLSVTVGLPNYGADFDKARVGIHGPVKLFAKSNDGEQRAERDISSSRWVYKTGLHGEDIGLNQVKPRTFRRFYKERRPANRMMIWYKTQFKTPKGTDPVVVDLNGLGKGVAWVNDFNIGRYWPKHLAPEDGCDTNCDYRGAYDPKKCSTNCGKPAQRWYHVPRYVLNEHDDNVLVLFEEFGGTPELVRIQTVTVGSICANAYEGNSLELSCQGGKTISQIVYASYGLAEGTCGSFKDGECHSPNSLSIVSEHCLGKQSCSIDVSEETFGALHCSGDEFRLAVEAVC